LAFELVSKLTTRDKKKEEKKKEREMTSNLIDYTGLLPFHLEPFGSV
jgi:hypothetical protein